MSGIGDWLQTLIKTSRKWEIFPLTNTTQTGIDPMEVQLAETPEMALKEVRAVNTREEIVSQQVAVGLPGTTETMMETEGTTEAVKAKSFPVIAECHGMRIHPLVNLHLPLHPHHPPTSLSEDSSSSDDSWLGAFAPTNKLDRNLEILLQIAKENYQEAQSQDQRQ
ncbi:hypothetical protein BT96DRAFT_1000571 [Gymnopus androsaceus JB14]|uniref:Uncharacterized protein n=1 Tax=Gymnopus androsaceus JB14 TaxID=1447944 RepID=A0A6A4H2E7_9AGAR|nr:hypothetical protein BT96DRAFT_1000571 [Gymnopus androsaceus JB14]